MSTSTQTWDGGSGAAAGTAISAANTAGSGNTAVASVAKNTPATVSFDATNVHSGTLACKIAHSGSSTAAYAAFTLAGVVGQRFVYRNYFWIDSSSTISANTVLTEFRNTAGTVVCLLGVTSGTGAIAISSSTGTQLITSGIAGQQSLFVRVELAITIAASGASLIELAVFNTDSTIPLYSGQVSSSVGNAALATMRLGWSVANTLDVWSDDLAWNESMASGWLGPTQVYAQAQLSGLGSLDAGMPTPGLFNAPNLSGEGALAATGTQGQAAAVSLSGAGQLAAASAPGPAGSAALSGTGQLGASTSPKVNGAAVLAGSGQLATAGSPKPVAVTALSGVGALTTSGTPKPTQAVSLSGAGTLSAGTPAPALAQSAAFSGSGALAASAAATPAATPALSGSGALSTAATPATSGAAALSGSGALATTSRVPAVSGPIALSGTGQLGFSPVPTVVQTNGGVTNAAAASVAVTLLSPPTAGHLLVAAVSFQGGSAIRTVTPPSGWTALNTTARNSSEMALFTKVSDGSERATTWTVATSGSNDYISALVYELAGVSATAPTAGVTYGQGGAASLSVSVGQAASISGGLLLGFVSTDNARALTSSAALDRYVAQTYHTTSGFHALAPSEAGVAQSITASWSGATAYAAGSVLIAPAALTGAPAITVAAPLSGSGQLDVGVPVPAIAQGPAFSGSGSLSSTAAGQQNLVGSATLGGTGTLTAGSLVAVAGRTEQVYDPSFEVGTGTRWAYDGTYFVRDATFSRTGGSSLKALPHGTTATRSNASIAIPMLAGGAQITVVPGETYTISAWAYATADYDGTGNNGKLRLAKGDGTLLAAIPWGVNSASSGTDHPGAWVQRAITLTIPAGTTNLSASLVSDHTVGTVWIDDVTFFRASDASVHSTYVDLSGSGALTAGVAAKPVQSVQLSGAGSLATSSAPRPAGTPALSGAGSLATTRVPAVSVSVPLSGSGSLSGTGAALTPVALSGSGSLTVSGLPVVSRGVAFSGIGVLGTGVSIAPGRAVSLSGYGALTVGPGTPKTTRAVPLAGAGTLSTTDRPGVAVTVPLAGSGQLAAGRAIGVRSGVDMTGAGGLTVTSSAGLQVHVELAGTGQLSAAGSLGISAPAALTGAGRLYARSFADFSAGPLGQVRVLQIDTSGLRVRPSLTPVTVTPGISRALRRVTAGW